MPSEASSGTGSLPLLRPDWDVPAPIRAAMSLRGGGCSAAPWDSLNLGERVGDDPACVARNRRAFAAAIGATPVWLQQVHGTQVLSLQHAPPPAAPRADAAWTREPGLACTVQVADCMPVLFAAARAHGVAAAHAGWRGLAAGVLEATLTALCEGTGCEARDVVVWLGPCIGPNRFEVGEDVLHAFGQAPLHCDAALFMARPRADGQPRWLANLPALARARLQRAGVQRICGGRWCTVEARSDFFSFRRDGVTGRHAAAIWIDR